MASQRGSQTWCEIKLTHFLLSTAIDGNIYKWRKSLAEIMADKLWALIRFPLESNYKVSIQFI
jgi:hypothetical protein